MTPAYDDRHVTIYGGDCREVMRALPAESVNCVVTSPPYWGLRDYGLPPAAWGGDREHEHVWGEPVPTPAQTGGTGRSTLGEASGGHAISAAGQERSQRRQAHGRSSSAWCECGAWLGCLGLEPDPFLFVEHLVDVFREIRRVLRPDGTAWLNLGDSYASKTRGSDEGWDKSRLTNPGRIQKAQSASMRSSGDRHRGKSAGLKSKDLCLIPARAAIALQDDGWWIRRDVIWHKPNPMPESTQDRPTSAHEYVFLLAKRERYYYDGDAIAEPAQSGPSDVRKMIEGRERIGGLVKEQTDPLLKASALTNIGRKRSVGGRVKTADDPHAGGRRQSPEPGEPGAFTVVGGQLMRRKRSVWTIATQPYPGAHFATFPTELVRPMIRAGCPPDGVVLDPFAGTGTVGLVAQQEGRRAVLIDLNPDYLRQCLSRTAREWGVGGNILEDRGGQHPAAYDDDSLWAVAE